MTEKAINPSIVMENDINPRWKLSTVLLNGINYIPWSRAVMLSLGGKKKVEFYQWHFYWYPKYEGWISNDQLIRSWLLNSMEAHIAEIFAFSNSTEELWNSVEELYRNQYNDAKIFELKRKIVAAEQGYKTFIEHIGYLKKKWDELSTYLPHATDAKILLNRVEEDKIFSLLSCLKLEYDNLKSHILMSSTLPTFSSVCTTVQREETRKKIMNFEPKHISESTALIVKKDEKRKSFQNKGKGKAPKCDHCHMLGHSKNRCWDLYLHRKPSTMKGGSKEVAAIADTTISLNQLTQIVQQLGHPSHPSPILLFVYI